MSSEEGEEVGKRAKEETAESEEARGKQRREGKNWALKSEKPGD